MRNRHINHFQKNKPLKMTINIHSNISSNISLLLTCLIIHFDSVEDFKSIPVKGVLLHMTVYTHTHSLTGLIIDILIVWLIFVITSLLEQWAMVDLFRVVLSPLTEGAPLPLIPVFKVHGAFLAVSLIFSLVCLNECNQLQLLSLRSQLQITPFMLEVM